MTYQDIINMCIAHVRESQRYTPANWRTFINAAQLELQQQTHILEGDVEVVVALNQRLYSVRDAGLLSLTEDPRFDGGRLARWRRSDLDTVADLTTAGTPTACYWNSAGVLALYPVPDATAEGKTLKMHGKMAPREVTMQTSLQDSPEFEYIDHALVAFGALIQAERVDKDLAVSDRIRQQYAEGLQNMRHRANNRQGGSKVVTPYGR